MLMNPINYSSKIGKLLRGFHYVKEFKHGLVVNWLRLQLSKILFYYFKKLCINIQNKLSILEPFLNDKNAANVAINQILKEFNKGHNEDNRL